MDFIMDKHFTISPELITYAEQHSTSESTLIQQLVADTLQHKTGSHMLSGRTVGQLLKFFIQLGCMQTVLDIGTYTGYTALMMAEALPESGKVITIDSSPESFVFAKRYFAQSSHQHKIIPHLGPALNFLPNLTDTFDLIYIDADKANTQHYYELCLTKLKTGGLIIVDDVLWYGEVLQPDNKRATAMQAFNAYVHQDPRVENVILPIRHGLNVIRKL
jgi:predicted O-methyltransferase YrrM